MIVWVVLDIDNKLYSIHSSRESALKVCGTWKTLGITTFADAYFVEEDICAD